MNKFRHAAVALMLVLMALTIASGPVHASSGRLLDLATQKGGLGQGVPGGTFTLGETVQLTDNVTYNGYPVQAQLVSFQVLYPQNTSFVVQTALTNNVGLVTIDFVIPYISDSLGTWTAISTTQLADQVIGDTLTFNVIYQVPPHGPEAVFTENTEVPHVGGTVIFNASSSIPGWDGTNLFPITEYRWDFGDGNKTTVSTPIVTHVYSLPGLYYVTLTVYAPGASPDTVTSLAQRKIVSPQVVGGYTVPWSSPAVAKPPMSYSVLAAILTIGLGVMRLLFSLFDSARQLVSKFRP
jgi:PKD repeat protein